ncbi:adenosylcobinamide-phosphate synthase CbiB [Geobacter argillaceus]|uniref:Cobalamin biosynthesis protein CobD n=1 Tax=Geobacter argillaceus TaxID=345631 RepID=A0A562VJE7_9BACT|nr:adenosylcobinamide-phosphate synthase CbiB [Geobacter argillaceus]TWJ17998.1 adenosylcobinamide-phosphate synthase [Geobacter argillaceus]
MNPQLSIPIVAVVLDLILGDPRWLPHPVILIGRMIAFLEGLLRRLIASERLGGIVLLLLTVSLTYGIALAVVTVASAVHPSAGIAVSALMAWTALAARSLHRESGLVAAAVERGDLPEARRYLSYIVGRDTADLDEPEIWRATVETVAENSSDGVIAPLFFLLLGGPPLALAYKAINTLDSMVGYKNDRYLRFGWASARCDDLANYLPARLTGLLMVLVAPLCGYSSRNSWRIMARDGRNHASPNSGVPEAATAGALGVQLGGTNSYFGRPVVKPTIGDPVRPLDRVAWRGAVRLMYSAEGVLLAGWLAAITVWQYWR